LTTMGIVLCLLATLFAIEAKLAWYGPHGSPASQISAFKLKGADAPLLVAQALASSELVPHLSGIAAIVSLTLMVSVARWTFQPVEALPVQSLSSGFSPHLFVRPPPAL